MNFHEFINSDGEVLILRRIPKSRTTCNNFKWPNGTGATVECPDWNDKAECGGGLHGWPWGFGLGEGCDYDIIDDIWLVIGVKPEDVVGELNNGAKCKFRRGTIRLEGSFSDAVAKVRDGFDGCVKAMAIENGKAAVSGDYGKAAVSGNGGKAAVSGDRGKCEAIGKNTLAAIAGTGKIRVGERGAFALAYWESDDAGWRFLVGKVGEDGIKPNTWYEICDGKITESANT